MLCIEGKIRNSWRAGIRLVLSLWVLIGSPLTQADEPTGTGMERVVLRHKIDLGISFLESGDTDSLIGAFTYTYNLTPRSNLSATLPYLDADFGRPGGSGVGDLELVYNWSPTQNIEAAPWIPKTSGTGILAMLPTGNAGDGRSLDSVILMPFLGLLVPISDHLFISPTFSYAHSLDRTFLGDHVDLAVAEVGMVWLGDRGGWVGFFPAYLRDFQTELSHYNYGVEAGKIFSSGIGFSVRYDDVEHFVPGSIPIGDQRFDQIITLNLHLVVGN